MLLRIGAGGGGGAEFLLDHRRGDDRIILHVVAGLADGQADLALFVLGDEIGTGDESRHFGSPIMRLPPDERPANPSASRAASTRARSSCFEPRCQSGSVPIHGI